MKQVIIYSSLKKNEKSEYPWNRGVVQMTRFESETLTTETLND